MDIWVNKHILANFINNVPVTTSIFETIIINIILISEHTTSLTKIHSLLQAISKNH